MDELKTAGEVEAALRGIVAKECGEVAHYIFKTRHAELAAEFEMCFLRNQDYKFKNGEEWTVCATSVLYRRGDEFEALIHLEKRLRPARCYSVTARRYL